VFYLKWIEVFVKTTSEFEEEVTNILYEANIQGIIIEDFQDVLDLEKNKNDWDIIDPDLLNNYYEGIIIKGYLEEDDDVEEKIDFIKEKIHGLPRYDLDIRDTEVEINTIEETDWNQEWKKHFKPFPVGKNFLIKPSWEEIDEDTERKIIEIDPGMAFGTGTHATTLMCLEALENYLKEDDLVYDIGTGSGILAIAAGKLGANSIGIDIDEDSVRTAKDNVKLNKCADSVKIIKGNLLNKAMDKADIIISNIIADAIINMSGNLNKFLKDSGIFIASGILENKKEEVVQALKANKFEILETSVMDEWLCIVARKGINE
jgi:ribosomal protein L11 methyltransferase